MPVQFRTGDVWPNRFTYILKGKFHDFAAERQAQAKRENLENGWYTARDAVTKEPRIIEIPREGQSQGPNSMSFKPGFQPRDIVLKHKVIEPVWHHVHGNFSAEPSANDLAISVNFNKNRKFTLFFAQHGNAGDDPTLFSALFGPAFLFARLPQGGRAEDDPATGPADAGSAGTG